MLSIKSKFRNEVLEMAIKYYRLMDYMNRNDIGKEELRIKLGVSSATMAKLSKNQPVSLDVIDKLCKVLNCQPENLIEYVPDKE